MRMQPPVRVCPECGSDKVRYAGFGTQRVEEVLKERFPDRKLLIVDSRGASSGYGLQMETLSKLRAEGRTIDELYDWSMNNRLHIHHLFCSTTLTYYVRGGRISPAAFASSSAMRSASAPSGAAPPMRRYCMTFGSSTSTGFIPVTRRSPAGWP